MFVQVMDLAIFPALEGELLTVLLHSYHFLQKNSNDCDLHGLPFKIFTFL